MRHPSRLQIYKKTHYLQTKHTKNSRNAPKNYKRPGEQPVFSEALGALLPGTRPLAGGGTLVLLRHNKAPHYLTHFPYRLIYLLGNFQCHFLVNQFLSSSFRFQARRNLFECILILFHLGPQTAGNPSSFQIIPIY